MCVGIAIPADEIPDDLLPGLAGLAGLAGRVHTRGGEPEVRFLWRARPALLPVWLDGRLQVVRWGNRDRSDRTLPPTGWTWRATVEAGRWAAMEPEEVDIPAGCGLMNGVWYKVKQGMKGLLVRTRAGEPIVFMVCEPATRYYRVMTRCEWMPVLIGEVI